MMRGIRFHSLGAARNRYEKIGHLNEPAIGDFAHLGNGPILLAVQYSSAPAQQDKHERQRDRSADHTHHEAVK